MEQARKTRKGRDFAIGFFSWLVFWSIAYQIKDYLGIGVETVINGVRSGHPDLGGYWVYGFPLVTVIAIVALFFTKKNWVAYGILATVIANILIFVLIGLLFGITSISGLVQISLEGGLQVPFFMVGGFY